MALRNIFQRSPNLLSIRFRAQLTPRALGYRCIPVPNARQFTVQCGWKLRPLVGLLALVGSVECCYLALNPELSSKNKAETQTNDISPEAIQHALDEAKNQDVPTDDEGKEAYFKQQYSRYESLCEDDSKRIEAAICFYRALEAFPALKDRSYLAGKTMPPPITDIVLKMMVRDPERNNRSPSPTEIEDKEAYFYQQMSRGEASCMDKDLDESKQFEAAMCFYRALQVYPSPEDLIGVYQETVPQPVLDALKGIIAMERATAIAKSQNSTVIGEEVYFTKLGEEEADSKQKEAYISQEVSRGRALCQDQDQDEKKRTEAAECFYRALKIALSIQGQEEFSIRNVPKPVIDSLSEMVARDPDLKNTIERVVPTGSP